MAKTLIGDKEVNTPPSSYKLKAPESLPNILGFFTTNTPGAVGSTTLTVADFILPFDCFLFKLFGQIQIQTLTGLNVTVNNYTLRLFNEAIRPTNLFSVVTPGGSSGLIDSFIFGTSQQFIDHEFIKPIFISSGETLSITLSAASNVAWGATDVLGSRTYLFLAKA